MSALPLQETLGRVAESGLPALLLQCLYLFFVFPLEKDELLESDVQVQRMFVQVSERRAPQPLAKTLHCFLEMSSSSSVIAPKQLCPPQRSAHLSVPSLSQCQQSYAFGKQMFFSLHLIPPCIDSPLFSPRKACSSSTSCTWPPQLPFLQGAFPGPACPPQHVESLSLAPPRPLRTSMLTDFA